MKEYQQCYIYIYNRLGYNRLDHVHIKEKKLNPTQLIFFMRRTQPQESSPRVFTPQNDSCACIFTRHRAEHSRDTL